MSVRSVKTAVIWAKPLREKERVESRPGVPASAVSSGNVTCFSISIGVSAGAMPLICTCTLVTSGTASIGSLVKDQAPDTAAARVARTTSQRWRTEKARIRLSNRSVLGQGLHQLSLERKRIRYGNHFAGTQPRHDLHETIVSPPQADWVPFEAFRRTDEDHLFIIDRLNRACRNDERDRLLFDHDGRSDERPGPPSAVAVGDLGYDMRGTRLLVEERADKHDLAVDLLRYCPGADRNRLSLLDGGQIRRTDGEFDPDPVKVDDHKELGFQVVPSNRCAQIDFTLDNSSRYRRPNALPPQRSLGLFGKSGDFLLRKAERQQLLACDVEPHPGLRGRVARSEKLLFIRDAFVPQHFVPLEQFLLQFIGESSGEVLALRIGDLAAFEDGQDLVLGDRIPD